MASKSPKSQPFSIRLGERAKLLVIEEARRSQRSRSAVVEELAEEAVKSRLHPGIAFRGRPRRAWVIGTGLDVWEIADLFDSYDGDVTALIGDHPLLSERSVRVALGYAAQFADEIAALRRENRPTEDELDGLYPFLQRLSE